MDNNEKKLGRVYKIVNDIDDEIYVGSTINTLAHRYSKHLEKINIYPDRSLYKKMIELGLDHFKIELIENYLYDNDNPLVKREQHYITELKPTLNMYNANGRNRDKKNERNRESYQRNKEARLAKVHEYASTHKEEIKERNKAYREKNADIIKQKKSEQHICEICGSHYTNHHKARHYKTVQHIKALNNQEVAVNV
jgi:group I intron endonuclease